MLTKTDLKEIRKILREEVETESQNIKTELQSDIIMSKMRIMSELDKIKDRLKNIEIKTNKIQKDLKYAVNFLDKDSLRISNRVERIEKHLKLPPLSSQL